MTSSSTRTITLSLSPNAYARASPAARSRIAGVFGPEPGPISCHEQPASDDASSFSPEPASIAPGLPSATSPNV